MIVKQTEGAANDGLSLALDVPRKAHARSKVVGVSRESLLHVKGILRGLQVGRTQSDSGQRILETNRRDRISQFDVVTHAIVKGKVWSNFPAILSKESQRSILDRAVGIAETLNKHGGEA